MTLISDYFIQLNEFQEKYGIKTAFFIQVGAFYEIYGIKNNITNIISKSNIQDIASICELNFGPRPHVSEHGQDNSVVAIGFRDYSLDKYLQKLNNQGYTVVVYDQDEQNKNTTRSLSGIYSPGIHLVFLIIAVAFGHSLIKKLLKKMPRLLLAYLPLIYLPVNLPFLNTFNPISLILLLFMMNLNDS